jgi:hypothetical protein
MAVGVSGFGEMSRAFETEADITAAHALGSGERLAKSLFGIASRVRRPDRPASTTDTRAVLARVRLLGAYDENPSIRKTATAPARRWRLAVGGRLLLALLGGARHLEDTLIVGPLRVAVRNSASAPTTSCGSRPEPSAPAHSSATRSITTRP